MSISYGGKKIKLEIRIGGNVSVQNSKYIHKYTSKPSVKSGGEGSQNHVQVFFPFSFFYF